MVAEHHACGGKGAVDLAKAVVEAAKQPSDFRSCRIPYALHSGCRVHPIWSARRIPLHQLHLRYGRSPSPFLQLIVCRFLYLLDQPIKAKIEAIASSYGAGSVEYSLEAEAQLERYTKQGAVS